MSFARYLTLALSTVSLIATPVLAQAADALASAPVRQGAAVDASEDLGGGGILGGGAFIFPLMLLFAVVLAVTVSDGGNSEEPTSP